MPETRHIRGLNIRLVEFWHWRQSVGQARSVFFEAQIFWKLEKRKQRIFSQTVKEKKIQIKLNKAQEFKGKKLSQNLLIPKYIESHAFKLKATE